MKLKTVNKQFRLVGVKGTGAFEEFGTLVPKAAQEVIVRSGGIESVAGKEIAVFEPKKSHDHLEGEFYVGLLVDVPLDKVPLGMTYMEVLGHYATARGTMEDLQGLHAALLKQTMESGFHINREEYIVEVYIPADTGEEVEIYLPILSQNTAG
ncbi:hypothetical protein SAMN04488127_1081 [Bhargavaea ginsengi]|uniref:GyrI-like small molecule binding domain-containing protein n=1 Tax=Bhargavaea ginsengi TaxID=426757 RepID=A0A1H6WMF7_9BACL|nr:GyrI-like domain-containing protein [Bhargavaea ginsengi]SEJ13950.1 hypothetical protein SAMN04488127_1081 [Bhargavaea ginsengi]